MNGMGIIARLICSYVDIHTGPINVLIPISIISGVTMYGWMGIDSSTGLYIFAVIYSLASNALQGRWPSVLISLSADLSKSSSRIGLGFTIVSFACLTGSPLGGVLMERDSGGYLSAQV